MLDAARAIYYRHGGDSMQPHSSEERCASLETQALLSSLAQQLAVRDADWAAQDSVSFGRRFGVCPMCPCA